MYGSSWQSVLARISERFSGDRYELNRNCVVWRALYTVRIIAALLRWADLRKVVKG